MRENRIWPKWWQIGTDSGRMASSGPNLQNMPPELRSCVRAPGERVLVVADYSQIELRIAAKMAPDQAMLEAFGRGEDIHANTARAVTKAVPGEEISREDRRLAKALNFGLLYGMSAAGLRSYAASAYGVELSDSEAREYRARFLEAYGGLKAWHDR